MNHEIERWKMATGKVICNDFRKTGSGFFISDEGLFLTNNHVVHNISFDAAGTIRIDYSEEIYVRIGEHNHRAFLAIDENSDQPIVYDYAILRLDITPEFYFNFTDIENLREGEQIMALGYPLGFNELIFTKGIISAILVRPSHINSLHRMRTILTDTLITYGNSGGPLIRMSDGRVIGINTMPHEIRDQIRTRLQQYLNQQDIEVSIPIQDIISFILKHIHTGFNYAISIEYAIRDPSFIQHEGGK